MPRLNDAYRNLRASYLLAEIKRRTQAFTAAHPDARLIDLGIGDFTTPLVPAVLCALHEAADEMGRAETFRGYGPYPGYDFLRELIAAHDFGARGITVAPDEIFVSDGGKSDSANLQEIFARDCVVALLDPVYPVYADSNVVAGRSGPADETGRYAGIVYLPCTADSGFEPDLPAAHADLVYLCFPNNPTGAVLTRAALGRWVEWARAREVALECRSFSKTAGFTGMRLAYTVVPREARGRFADGERGRLHELWSRRVAIRSNGAPYVIQRAAAAIYTPEGQAQVRAVIDAYMANARVIAEGLGSAGFTVHGGRNAPYLWVRAPVGLSSWDFFDALLTRANVVGVPGSGFGPSGEGYFRLTAFGTRDHTEEAVARIRTRL